MNQNKICLASDNWSPAHPLILKAILEANQGSSPPYGSDPWTHQALTCIQEVFKKPCKILMITNGTGANVLALKLSCKRYQSVICTDIAHINYQESGSAESIVGCKLLSIPHQEGKITPQAISRKLKSERAFGKHSTSPQVISITQPTEIGTIYSLEELRCLSKLAQEENLLLHMDGSRIYNAAARLKVGLDEMIEHISIDLLSLGGTKNGLIGAEALLIFNETLLEGSDHLQKQTLLLLSKMRYLSAQFIPFFENNLWHTLALQSNQKAKEIGEIITKIPHLSLSHPIETNQIFFTAPYNWIPLIQEKIACYPWNLEKNEIRFITSWNTTDQEVEDVQSILLEISRNSAF